MDTERLAAIPPITDECLVCDHIQAHIDALQAENERLQQTIAALDVEVADHIDAVLQRDSVNSALQARVTLLEGKLRRALANGLKHHVECDMFTRLDTSSGTARPMPCSCGAHELATGIDAALTQEKADG